MRDISVTSRDGARIAVRDHGGAGPDVLLLHGMARTLLDWTDVLRFLDGARAVSMDLRWHGASDAGTRFDRNDFLGDIDGFDITRPELYDGIDPEEAERFVGNMRQMQAGMVPDADEGDAAWRAAEIERAVQMDLSFGVTPAIADEGAERMFPPIADGVWARRPPASFIQQVTSAAWESPILDETARAASPLLNVLCVGTAKLPPQIASFFAAGKRGNEKALRSLAETNANLGMELVDASHFVIFERPDEVARIVKAFIAS